MNKSININISGGASTFGVITQADNIHSQNIDSKIAANLANCLKELEGLANKQNSGAQAMPTLTETANEIASAANTSSPPSKVLSLLNIVKEHYQWAYPAIASFATTVWPTLVHLFK